MISRRHFLASAPAVTVAVVSCAGLPVLAKTAHARPLNEAQIKYLMSQVVPNHYGLVRTPERLETMKAEIKSAADELGWSFNPTSFRYGEPGTYKWLVVEQSGHEIYAIAWVP
jgi:hypothetical protein